MRDTSQRLLDIQACIDAIAKYSVQGKEAFYENELIETWIVRHLEIIGEAARAIPQEFKVAHPEIPWKEINAMRNLLVHLYFKIDQKAVWMVVERDLPALQKSIQPLLSQSDDSDSRDDSNSEE